MARRRPVAATVSQCQTLAWLRVRYPGPALSASLPVQTALALHSVAGRALNKQFPERGRRRR